MKTKKGFVEKPLVVKVLTTHTANIKTPRTQIMSGESDSLPVILAFGRLKQKYCTSLRLARPSLKKKVVN